MNRFNRTISLIGEDNFNKIQNLKVAIIGLGGVGGYTAETLARMGVNNLILVDYDTIDITNINRQIIATTDNIGNKKVLEFKKRIEKINNRANIITLDMFLNEDNIDKLLEYKIDYIVDACDSLNTKKLIISICNKYNIKLISSLGMGNKLHPEKIEITTLDKTNYDPIAKILRKYVKDNHINNKITVIFSSEKPLKKDKVITSVSFVPSIAGIYATSYIINDYLNKSSKE